MSWQASLGNPGARYYDKALLSTADACVREDGTSYRFPADFRRADAIAAATRSPSAPEIEQGGQSLRRCSLQQPKRLQKATAAGVRRNEFPCHVRQCEP
jgi:hypothetical protein